MFLFTAFLMLGGWLGTRNEQEAGFGVAAQTLPEVIDNIYINEPAPVTPCVLPEPPQNGNYTVINPERCLDSLEWKECKYAPGKKVPHTQQVSVSCKPGYKLRGYISKSVVICNNGTWSDNFPVCESYYTDCGPLISRTAEVKCVYDGRGVSCNSSVPIGTAATTKCRKNFRQPQSTEQSSLKCLSYGQWSHPLVECEPSECGVALPPVISTSSRISAPQQGYPWSASIFSKQTDGTWSMAGLGTLITSQVVLTELAGLDTRKRLKAGLGPFNRDNYTVYIDVKKTVTSPNHSGRDRDKSAMLLIFLSDPVKVSARLMPACVDWDNSHTVASGSTGHVVSWNGTNNLLKYNLDRTYFDTSSCRAIFPGERIADDKVCAVDETNGPIRSGTLQFSEKDSGSGMTVVVEGSHVLVGLLSSYVLLEDVTKFTFTSVKYPENTAWIAEEIKHFESEEDCERLSNCADDGPIFFPQRTTIAPRNKCTVPGNLENRILTQYNCSHSRCIKASGDKVQHGEVVTVSCSPGSSLVSGMGSIVTGVFMSCQDGVWDRDLPECYRMCPPLVSPTVDFKCWQGPTRVNCDKPMLPETQVEYSCKENQEKSDKNNPMRCLSNGTWSKELPQCNQVEVLCPPLTSPTVDFKCWQGPTQVNCDKPMLADTLVEYSCKQHHESSERIVLMRCLPNGTWSRELPKCSPSKNKCGMSTLNNDNVPSPLLESVYSRPGNFPWHAALYFREGDSWEAKCGGTLVSTRHVITVAHCVTSPCENCKREPLLPGDVMVGLGKTERVWDAKEGIKSRINTIHVHPAYSGQTQNHANDIAVLVLDSEVAANNNVIPVCLNFNQSKLEEMRQKEKQPGYVAGWGNPTSECISIDDDCDKPSDRLKFAQTSIIGFEKCLETTQEIQRVLITRLTTDKFCAGNGSMSVVQQGDSGGGLTFNFGGLYHIYGVVSIKLKLRLDNDAVYNFASFTNVSFHLDWLDSVIN